MFLSLILVAALAVASTRAVCPGNKPPVGMCNKNTGCAAGTYCAMGAPGGTTPNQPFNQAINQPINQPINQQINQPFQQPINQPFNQQINQQGNGQCCPQLAIGAQCSGGWQCLSRNCAQGICQAVSPQQSRPLGGPGGGCPNNVCPPSIPCGGPAPNMCPYGSRCARNMCRGGPMGYGWNRGGFKGNGKFPGLGGVARGLGSFPGQGFGNSGRFGPAYGNQGLGGNAGLAGLKNMDRFGEGGMMGRYGNYPDYGPRAGFGYGGRPGSFGDYDNYGDYGGPSGMPADLLGLGLGALGEAIQNPGLAGLSNIGRGALNQLLGGALQNLAAKKNAAAPVVAPNPATSSLNEPIVKIVPVGGRCTGTGQCPSYAQCQNHVCQLLSCRSGDAGTKNMCPQSTKCLQNYCQPVIHRKK